MSKLPVSETPFKTSLRVVCGQCNGRKLIATNDSLEECPLCFGEGMLLRVTEGAVKLYRLTNNTTTDVQ